MRTPASTRAAILLLCGISAGVFLCSCRSTSSGSKPSDPPSPQALTHFSLGLLDELHTDTESAATNFLAAIEHDPENEELYWLAAERLTVQSRKEEAMEIFDLLIQRKPKSQSGYLWKGWLLQTMQEPEQAELSYRKAIKVAPKYLGSYMRLTHLLLTQENLDEAAKVLERARRKVDEPLRAYDMLGDIYQRQAKKAETPAPLWEKAYALYNRALKQYPENRKFRYQRGIQLLRMGEMTDGLEQLIAFEELSPNNIQVKQEIINNLIQILGSQDAAIQAVQNYLDENPTQGQARYYLAGLYELKANYAQAMEHYAESAKLLTGESAATWKHSVLLVQQTNLTEAVAVIQKGLTHLPDDLRLGEMLAFVELQRSNFTASVEAFAQVEQRLIAAGQRANMQNLWMNYAIAAQQQGDTDLAARKVLQAIEVKPEVIRTFSGRMFQQSNQEKVLKDGIAIYQKVVEALPNNPYAHFHLGLFYNYSRDFEATAQAFKSTEEIIQETFQGTELLNAYFYFLYAASVERTGDLEEAEALFFECLEKDNKHAEANNYLAYMWAENNLKLDKALKYVDRALEIEPENGAYLDTKGWIYFQQGDYTNALTYLERANTLIPNDPTITDHVGDALHKLGREDEARTYWEQAMELAPENTAIAEKLERATDNEAPASTNAAPTEMSSPENPATPAPAN